MNETTSTTPPTIPSGGVSAEEDEQAKRARKARQAWLEGPTEEEMIAWARQERMRRLAEADLGGVSTPLTDPDVQRLAMRYGREAQLAAEGAFYLLLTSPWRVFAMLVRGGREFEAGIGSLGPRRRVPFYTDEK